MASARAIINGLASDGGLYVPDDLSELAVDYKAVIAEDYLGMAKRVLSVFFPDFSEVEISEIVDRSYRGKFETPNIAPLVSVGEAFVLELYHGPTAAFKDVALSVLPKLVSAASRKLGFEDEIMILTATSGDTGSAALCGFSDVPGTKIIVFYPEGGVSDTQRLQMVTAKGGNVRACAVRGNFDDAQTGVKRILSGMPHPKEGVSLSSANSINIGRLVPQVVYYFAAYKQLVGSGAIEVGDKVDFSVPTGNFGDIMAGWFAREMGLPVGRLICASNRNDVLTEFIETGHYDRRREFKRTTSPSMDILVSSNLERLLYFVCGAERTREYMRSLAESGEYSITDEELSKIQEVFACASCDEEECADAIREVFRDAHYLMDTHTAVAWRAHEKLAGKAAAAVVLSTASPYKFSKAVLSALGVTASGSDRERMELLREVSGAPVPGCLSAVFSEEERHRDVIGTDDMQSYVLQHA